MPRPARGKLSDQHSEAARLGIKELSPKYGMPNYSEGFSGSPMSSQGVRRVESKVRPLPSTSKNESPTSLTAFKTGQNQTAVPTSFHKVEGLQ